MSGTFGKYQLVERLGRGGMAEVWKAKITGPGGFRRTLVVKRILPHLAEDPHFVQMFLGEARLSAQLNHPNIVAVHELGDVDGEYFIAMEHVAGRDLVSLLRTMVPIGVPEPGMGALVVRDVARALSYAHGLRGEDGQPLRIIHRDVSPSNVMVSFDGAVKLVDFGLAKALAETNDDHTKTGTLKGKFGYMSPEQIIGIPLDHRIDVFAAGVVLWESLTGRRLFKGDTDMHTIALVREAKALPPSTLNPSVTPLLDEIARKALARDREDRYSNCEELAQDLDEAVRELRWGPDRLQVLMRELFPEGDRDNKSIDNTAPTLATEPEAISVPRQRRWPWLVAGILACAAAGTWGVVLSRHHGAEAPAAVVHAAPRQVAAPAVVAPMRPAPVAQSRVSIEVQSSPKGAQIFIDDSPDPLGIAPTALTLPRSSQIHRVRLHVDGYVDKETELAADRDARVVLDLVKAAEPPAQRPHRKGASHGPRAAPQASPAAEVRRPEPPTGEVKRDDLVDPFK